MPRTLRTASKHFSRHKFPLCGTHKNLTMSWSKNTSAYTVSCNAWRHLFVSVFISPTKWFRGSNVFLFYAIQFNRYWVCCFFSVQRKKGLHEAAKNKKINISHCSCFTLNAFKWRNNNSVRLHIQHQWCNSNVMSSNPTQSPLLLESLTQTRSGISHLILELKKTFRVATLPCSALQVLPARENFLHEFRQLANDSAGSTIEPERWQNQSHGDMEDVRKAPPEADDRSHTGGRCDGGRQRVNSTLRPAAQRHVGRHTKLHFTLKTCAHAELKHFGREI